MGVSLRSFARRGNAQAAFANTAPGGQTRGRPQVFRLTKQLYYFHSEFTQGHCFPAALRLASSILSHCRVAAVHVMIYYRASLSSCGMSDNRRTSLIGKDQGYTSLHFTVPSVPSKDCPGSRSRVMGTKALQELLNFVASDLYYTVQSLLPQAFEQALNSNTKLHRVRGGSCSSWQVLRLTAATATLPTTETGTKSSE